MLTARGGNQGSLSLPHPLSPFDISSLPAQHLPPPSCSCSLGSSSGAKGMLSSFFLLKAPKKPNSLQSNHCMSVSDTEGTRGFILVAAPRGIRSWISSSRKAGSHRHCQHGCCCCWSPGEPPHEQHSSAGMHGCSAKSKGCFPSQSGA